MIFTHVAASVTIQLVPGKVENGKSIPWAQARLSPTNIGLSEVGTNSFDFVKVTMGGKTAIINRGNRDFVDIGPVPFGVLSVELEVIRNNSVFLSGYPPTSSYYGVYVRLRHPAPTCLCTGTERRSQTGIDDDAGIIDLDASASYPYEGTTIDTYEWIDLNTQGNPVTTSNGPFQTYNFPPRDTDYTVNFSVRVRSNEGLWSAPVLVAVLIPARRGDQIACLQFPTGAMFTAQTQKESGAKSVPIFYWQGKSNPATVFTLPNAEKPTLFAPLVGGQFSSAIALLARDTSSSAWRLWRSLSGARTMSPMATVFSSSLIDYAHAAAIPGGAVAVAVLKSIPSGSTGKLIFKRTSDLSKWPDDSKAITVKEDVKNAPFHVLTSAQGRNELTITDGKTLWLVSKNGGRTWS